MGRHTVKYFPLDMLRLWHSWTHRSYDYLYKTYPKASPPKFLLRCSKDLQAFILIGVLLPRQQPGKHSSLRVRPLVDFLCSSGWLYTCSLVDNPIGLGGIIIIINKRREGRRRKCGRIHGVGGFQGEMRVVSDPIVLYKCTKFLNNKRKIQKGSMLNLMVQAYNPGCLRGWEAGGLQV